MRPRLTHAHILRITADTITSANADVYAIPYAIVAPILHHTNSRVAVTLDADRSRIHRRNCAGKGLANR